LKPKKIKSYCLQNRFKSNINLAGIRLFISTSTLLILLLPALSAQIIRKTEVSFKASDGLLVTADLYQSKKSNPYIILCHQELSCKGEFDSIASRFIKMNYNCMALDLRSGDNMGFLKNETAFRAKENGFTTSLNSASQDIEAAIDFLLQYSNKKICLFGSASSASLALIVGRYNEHVKAVVAFSPGDYFTSENNLKEILANYPKPVFVACTTDEFTYLSNIEGFPGPDKILFKPSLGKGIRGTGALLKENPGRDEYWLSMLIFFKSLQSL
jgi:dienelactone hydrolase